MWPKPKQLEQKVGGKNTIKEKCGKNQQQQSVTANDDQETTQELLNSIYSKLFGLQN